MKRRRVAYPAADHNIAPAAQKRVAVAVPVLDSLKAGWRFFFLHFRQIAARLWFTAVLLAIIEYVARANTSVGLGISLAYIFLYLFAFANLYALALGSPLQRPVLAGFAVGPDELRFFFVTLIYFVVAALLLVGAYLIGRQLVDYLSVSGDIAKLANPRSLEGIRWFQEMPLLQRLVFLAPIAFAAIVILWLSARYVFVPLHVIAVRKLAIFNALALTKGNSWRLFLLMLALGFILFGVGWAIQNAVIGVERLLIDGAQKAIHHGAGTFASGHHSVFKTGVARPVPEWIAPVVLTFTNLMAAAVTVGTLSFAYKKVTAAAQV